MGVGGEWVAEVAAVDAVVVDDVVVDCGQYCHLCC